MPYFEFQDKKIYYEDQGSGEVVVLLPANMSSSAVHKEEIAYFSQKYRVICPDYIGYGRSERLKELPMDFWWINAEMVVALLKHLGIHQCYSIGINAGGIIAFNIAIIQPNKILGIVADSFIGEYLEVNEVNRIITEREKQNSEQRGFWSLAHGETWEKIIFQDNNILLTHAKKGESLNKDRLKEIQSPILFISSIKDDLVNYIEDKIIDAAKQTKAWKIVFYPSGGQPVIWSKPTEFRQEVEKFVAAVEENDSLTPSPVKILEETESSIERE